MVAIQQGGWAILSVEATTAVFNYQGYQRMEISGNELTIQPVGMRFVVQQATPQSAVLESGGQLFFADFSKGSSGQLSLELSRPQLSERILINAKFDS